MALAPRGRGEAWAQVFGFFKKNFVLFHENIPGGSTSVLSGLPAARWSMGWFMHGGPRRRGGLGWGAWGAASFTCSFTGVINVC